MIKKKLLKERILILYCARLKLTEKYSKSIHALLKERIDWDEIYNISDCQKVLPFLYYTLGKFDFQHVPAYIIKKAENYYYSNLCKNLLAEKEISYLLELTNKEGLDIIPIKGFSLIQTLYRDPGLRIMADIDILIQACDIQRINTIFNRLGYKKSALKINLPGYEIVFLKKTPVGQSIIIEVHDSIIPPRPFKLEIPALWKRTEIKEIYGQKLICLSKEDTFLTLALHLRRHARCLTLKFIVDIAELLNISENKFDWDYVHNTAKNNHIMNSVYVSLYLAKELLETTISHKLIDRFRPNIIKNTLIHITINKHNFFSLTKKQGTFLRFLLFDRLIDFIFYLWRVSFIERFITKLLPNLFYIF